MVVIVIVAAAAVVVVYDDDDDDSSTSDDSGSSSSSSSSSSSGSSSSSSSSSSDDSDDTDDTSAVDYDSISYDAVAFDDVRLQIYGNADGDDYIDADDVSVLEWIIARNTDSSTTNDIDWETDFPFADADYDGDVDSDDIAVVEAIIEGESTKMYYYNFYERVTYVNYPISQSIGAEYLVLQLLPALQSYSMLTAVDTDTINNYGDDVYPGVSSMTAMSARGEMTVDEMMNLYSSGTIGTWLQWTGGQNSDYFWDDAEAAGLTDYVSIVIVPCQGPDVIKGVLMLGCMLGDQTLAEDYAEWYDEAMDLLDSIEEQLGEKKTITIVRCYSQSASGIACFGSAQGPALWFNEVVNFQDAYVGLTNFTSLGSIDSFNASATDEVIVMFQKSCSGSEFNQWVVDYLGAVYNSTTQFQNGTMYCIDFELMPYSGGPAGCYILASYLYPDLFDFEDAMDFLQVFLDKFSVSPDADAYEGYTYTGEVSYYEAWLAQQE